MYFQHMNTPLQNNIVKGLLWEWPRAGRFRATLLLRTIRMRSQRLGGFIHKQTNKDSDDWIFLQGNWSSYRDRGNQAVTLTLSISCHFVLSIVSAWCNGIITDAL